MQEGASGERARGDRMRPAEPPPSVPLPSLRAMGWALQRGASTLLTTPVGSILLPASQSGKEAALSLDQCCLERWENVVRIGPVTVPMWWLVLTASGLMFVAFFQFYLSFALGLAYRSWEYCRPAALVLPTAFVTPPAMLSRYVLQASCILTIFASAGAVLTFLVRASKAARSALAFGLTPHDVDIAGRVQPEGYGIKGLLLMRLSAHAIYGFVVLLMFEFFDNVLIAEGLDREAEWAPFKQAGLLGGYHDLPPHRRWNVISVVVFIKMCEMQSSFAPTSQVFHMWHRGRGRPAFWPRSEKDTVIE